jgi:hypothetical protein
MRNVKAVLTIGVSFNGKLKKVCEVGLYGTGKYP